MVNRRHGYDKAVCLAYVIDQLRNNATFRQSNPSYFAPSTTLETPILTLPGCVAMCSNTWGVYYDATTRVWEYIIPITLVLANLSFVAIGRRRYLVVIHVLGDPIDCFHRLLKTVEDWHEAYHLSQTFIARQKNLGNTSLQYPELAAEKIATILGATARVFHGVDVRFFLKRLYARLNLQGVSEVEVQRVEEFYRQVYKTATVLRELRLHDFRRTAFAVFTYFLQVVSLFVWILGAAAVPSGGRISPSMVLVFLVPLALLSNKSGDYPSWKQTKTELVELFDLLEIDYEESQNQHTERETKIVRGKISWITSLNELECTGAVDSGGLYAFPSLRRIILVILSILPLTLACTTAFIVDYTPHTYYSCRATSILLTYAAWLISSVATRSMLRFRRVFGRHIWLSILLKDAMIAIPILAILLVSTTGLFNSYHCSSGYIARGAAAFVELDPSRWYPHNNQVIYPAVVFVGLGVQLLYVLLVRLSQLQAFKTMWWKESI